jgi:putative endonuclease
MARATDAVGRYGEDVAVAFLQAAGMDVLARNWRCPTGELDAVLRDGDVTVFAEVKTRRSDRYGTPAEAVHPAKVTRLRRLAGAYLAANPQHHGEIRFDVLSVRPSRRGAAEVVHLRGAF